MKITLTICLLLAAIWTNGALAQPHSGSRLIYQAFPAGPIVEIDVTRSAVILDGHNVLAGKWCESRKELTCLTAGSYVFAYPKTKIRVGERWEVNGAVFQTLQETSRHVLGKAYRVYVIEQRVKNEVYWHLYSRHFGLLAFGGGQGEGGTYLLQGRCGFAASDKCS